MALVPPGKTLKAQVSNTLLKFKYWVASLPDDKKYEQCEAQLRTVQVSLAEWRALLVRPPFIESQIEKYNAAASQNNDFMADLKKCKAAKYADLDKKLEEIFAWRLALSQQSASLKVPGPKYDLTDVVKTKEALVIMARVVIPPPPRPAPAPAQSSNQGAKPDASAPPPVPMSLEYAKVAYSSEWFPQQQLTPSPSRTTYGASRPFGESVTPSVSGISSLQGGLSGAQGSVSATVRPSAASGVGALDSASLKSTFGLGSEHSYGSFSSGSGGGYRTSTDSSGSASHYQSARQSLDSHTARDAGGQPFPLSGGLRSGLQGAAYPSIAPDLSHAMSSMHISPPPQGGPPPPQMLANPASAFRATHPGQQRVAPPTTPYTVYTGHPTQAAHAGVPPAGLQQPHAGAPRPRAPQPSTIAAAPPAAGGPSGMVNPLLHMQPRATVMNPPTQAAQPSQTQTPAFRHIHENNINAPRRS